MPIFKTFLSIVAVLFAIFIIGGLMMPVDWSISRSIVIHATPEQIYPWVSDFKQWEKWSPWNSSEDDTLKYTYSGPERGVGAKQNWTSKKMGNGWMQFTAADPQTGVSYDLFIDMAHMQSTLHGQITFQPQGDDTLVTWTDQGHSGDGLIQRWISPAVQMLITKELETGLTNLKTAVERT